jgi:hypothetical protein
MTDDFCNKCGECCKHIKADFEAKILYWDGKQPLPDSFAEMLNKTSEPNIYSCKFLKNNLCTNHNKPEICIKYPSSPFVNLPEQCTYCGYIFMQKEKIKQQIRKFKEEIIHYNAIIESIRDKREQNQLQKIVASRQKFIDKYKEYGSENW